MKCSVAFTLVAFFVNFSVVAFAQQVDPGSPRATVAQTLPAQSFDELLTKLRVGDKVIIRDADGRSTRGRLSRLTDDQIDVKWGRMFRRRARSFNDTDVRRIEIQDSAWNGALIGLGVAGAGTGLGCKADDGGYACLYLVLLAPFLGATLGASVDLLINRPIYETPGGTTATLLPLIGSGRIGFTTRLRF